MVGIPIPGKGTAFIYVMDNEDAIEYVGVAHLVLKDSD